MTEICIGAVEYSFQNDIPLIHLFGRDKDGTAHRVDVSEFKPYFFVPTNESNRITPDLTVDKQEFLSIKKEPLMKIYLKKPTDIYDVRDRFTHYEADVHFSTRFLIDTGIKSGVSFPSNQCDYKDLKPVDLNLPARVCILDIECDDSRGFPDALKDQIFCITCYDSFEKRYTSFVIATKPIDMTPKENGCFNLDVHDVMIYEDEKSLLIDLASYIKGLDFDIITGWNSNGFDLPYILARLDKLGISRENISRLRGNSQRIEIRGRQLFDLLDGYRRMHLGEQPSYRLDAIAFAEVGQQKIRFAGKVSDLWKDDPTNLVYYNFTDTNLCYLIDAKDGTVDFHRHISHYVGCPLEKSTSSMPIIDTYILRKSHGRFVLPSKSNTVDKSTEGFAGATVFETPVGLKENVVVLDLKSLYPMIMLTCNCSPETKSPTGELITPIGVRFKREPDGLVREIQNELLKERDSQKTKRNVFEFDSPEYKHLDLEQNVTKVLMNSYYGVSGNPTFRLYDKDVGAAITSVGRAILEHNRKLIVERGYQVVLGDTDSCGVKIPKSLGRENTMAIAKDLEKMLNDSYPTFAKETLNADVQYFSIKFEKLYERFFSSGKKKRYAGLLVWKEGKTVNQVDITGFETERSDSPTITRNAMKMLISMVLEGKEYSEIQPVISEIIRKYRAREYSLDEIGIPGRIGKNLEDYDHPDAQVRGAIYSNKYLGTHFGKGSKPKRLYIKSMPFKYPRTDVICFEYADEVPSETKIDFDTMILKTLEGPISRILEPLGWQWENFDPSITTLKKWGLE
jgi:DNA polymerase I